MSECVSIFSSFCLHPIIIIYNKSALFFRVIECKGPTNTRVYTVAVYFQGKRLAKASGHSIQEAEMNSAKVALEKSQGI